MELNKIYCGDCLGVMKGLPDNSIDLILTDPPYGIKFMSKNWDSELPDERYWEEMLRVAKPGAYLLTFGGTRTYHRLTCKVEDVGWEIRDTVAYLNNGDKQFNTFWESLSPEQQQAYLETHQPNRLLQWVYSSGFPKGLNIGKAIDKRLGKEREVVGEGRWYEKRSKSTVQRADKPFKAINTRNDEGRLSTKPATKLAAKWEGWNTNLKPAWEPIIMGRKPLNGNILDTVLEFETGALNIDKCRTESDRYPANVIHDGTQLVLDLFPETSAGRRKECRKYENGVSSSLKSKQFDDRLPRPNGSVSRFFYCAKSSPKERGKDNNHPTVKPLKLVEYLIELASRENAIILDPFAGSGTTAIACQKLNRNFIVIEKNPDYCTIIESRLRQAN